METQTTNPTLAMTLADHDVILSPSCGLLHVEATPNGTHQVILNSVKGAEYLYLGLQRLETGWQIVMQGGSAAKLSAKQEAEISALVKEWAKAHVQNFVDADRIYFFDLIEASADLLLGDEDDGTHIPCTRDEDTDFCKALDELGPSFLTPAARDGVRRGIDLATSAKQMIREAEALLRHAAAERKAA